MKDFIEVLNRDMSPCVHLFSIQYGEGLMCIAADCDWWCHWDWIIHRYGDGISKRRTARAVAWILVCWNLDIFVSSSFQSQYGIIADILVRMMLGLGEMAA